MGPPPKEPHSENFFILCFICLFTILTSNFINKLKEKPMSRTQSEFEITARLVEANRQASFDGKKKDEIIYGVYRADNGNRIEIKARASIMDVMPKEIKVRKHGNIVSIDIEK